MTKSIKRLVSRDPENPSMKRSILMYTWIWTILIVTAVIIKFILDPSEEFSNGLVGISTLIGIPLSAAYMGMLFGEYNNRKDKEILSKLPNVSTPTETPVSDIRPQEFNQPG